MGGRGDPALDIVNWLIAHDVRASVFMTGAMVDSTATTAGRDVLGLVQANAGRFTLGNHSYHHPDFTELGAQAIRDELVSTERAIAGRSSLDPRPFFRPPFGAYDGRVLAAVGAAGYSRTVRWDVDTIDWRPVADGGPTADDIVAKVLGNARNGSIVLMHLGGYNTYAALPRIVAGLRANGYDLVTLREMLGG